MNSNTEEIITELTEALEYFVSETEGNKFVSSKVRDKAIQAISKTKIIRHLCPSPESATAPAEKAAGTFVPCEENDPSRCGSYTSNDGQSMCYVKPTPAIAPPNSRRTEEAAVKSAEGKIEIAERFAFEHFPDDKVRRNDGKFCFLAGVQYASQFQYSGSKGVDLVQLFENNFDCYTQCSGGTDVWAMSQEKFIEVVSKLLSDPAVESKAVGMEWVKEIERRLHKENFDGNAEFDVDAIIKIISESPTPSTSTPSSPKK